MHTSLCIKYFLSLESKYTKWKASIPSTHNYHLFSKCIHITCNSITNKMEWWNIIYGKETSQGMTVIVSCVITIDIKWYIKQSHEHESDICLPLKYKSFVFHPIKLFTDVEFPVFPYTVSFNNQMIPLVACGGRNQIQGAFTDT